MAAGFLSSAFTRDWSDVSNAASSAAPYAYEVGKTVAVEGVAHAVDRLTWGLGGAWIRSNYYSPSWVTAPFVRNVGRSLARSTRSGLRRAFGSSRAPYVPQRRYPRQYVRQSFAGDRFRSGSRNVFYEGRGDWKKQFIGFK